MNHPARFVALLATMLVLLASTFPDSAWGDRATASRLYDEGHASFEDGKYKKALGHFIAARALLPSGKRYDRARNELNYFIGMCQLRLGRPTKALVFLERFLRGRGGVKRKKAARGAIARLKGMIRVTGGPGKGRAAGKKTKAAGGRKGTVSAKAGKTGTKGGTKAKAGGRKADGGKGGKGRRVVAVPGGGKKIPAPGTPPKRSLAPWIVIGAGAAAAVTGAVFIGLGKSSEADANDRRTAALSRVVTAEDTKEISSLHETAGTQLTVGWVLAGAGVAAAGAGLVWMLLKPRRAATAMNTAGPSRLAWRVTPGPLGVQLQGAF